MSIITASVLQNWLDISIQYTGSASNAYAISFANNRSVTDPIQGGEQLMIPDDLHFFNKEVSYLEGKRVIPATGFTNSYLEAINPAIGIGTMRIGATFKVR